jgi:hypothetical protein
VLGLQYLSTFIITLPKNAFVAKPNGILMKGKVTTSSSFELAW